MAFLLLIFPAAMYAVDGGPFKSGHPLVAFYYMKSILCTGEKGDGLK